MGFFDDVWDGVKAPFNELHDDAKGITNGIGSIITHGQDNITHLSDNLINTTGNIVGKGIDTVGSVANNGIDAFGDAFKNLTNPLTLVLIGGGLLFLVIAMK